MKTDYLADYKTNKDYSRLKELLDNGKRVLVFSKYSGKIAVFFKKNEFIYHFWRSDDFSSSNDTWNFTPWDEGVEERLGEKQSTFFELCEKYDLEFIEPNN